MKRNPINVFNETLSKAGKVMEYAIRSHIMHNRLRKLNAIDLRKYRGKPEKKEQIRRLKKELIGMSINMSIQAISIAHQPICKSTFKSGGIINEGGEIIINKIKWPDQAK